MGQAHWTKRHGSITILDGAGTPKTYVNDDLEVGDFSASNLQDGNFGIVAVKARGAFQGAEHADDQEIGGSFTINLKREAITHASNDRIFDIVNKSGGWASATTVNPGGTEVWMVDIKYQYSDGTTTTSLTYNTCRLVADFDESGDVDTFRVNFTCYEGVTAA